MVLGWLVHCGGWLGWLLSMSATVLDNNHEDHDVA